MDHMEIREKAAQLIEKRGWCQHRYFGDNGELCIVGALDSVGAPENVCTQIMNELNCGISSWNDRAGRTVDEVLAALRGTLRAAV